MRASTTNPFSPGSDRIPAVWAGRVEQLGDWNDRLAPRRQMGLYERGRVLLGEPGIGKSVLAKKIAAQARADGHLTTGQIRVPSGVSPFPLVAEALLALAHDAGLSTRGSTAIAGLLDRVRSLTVAGTGIAIDPPADPAPHRALTDLIRHVALAGRNDRRLVVIQLDEIQNIKADLLSQLLVAFGDVLADEIDVTDGAGQAHQMSLPVVVYLSGLPEFADSATSRHGATFTRRFATTLLGPIDDDDLHAALVPFRREGWPTLGTQGPEQVWMTDDAADRLVALVGGDPFLFQLAGQAAWDASDTPTITLDDVEAGWAHERREIRRHVERQLDRLPANERAVLDTMARIAPGERTATNIARALGHTEAAQIGSATQRLDTVRGIIERGKPYRFRIRTIEALLTDPNWP